MASNEARTGQNVAVDSRGQLAQPLGEGEQFVFTSPAGSPGNDGLPRDYELIQDRLADLVKKTRAALTS